jgi:hypothetical protein
MFAVPSGVVQRNEYIGKVSVFVIVVVIVVILIVIVFILVVKEVHIYEVIIFIFLFVVDGKIIICRFIVDDGVVKATKGSMQFRRSFVSFGIERRI